MLRRFWLLFAQIATVCVAALFVVATLRPDLLARFTGKNNVVLVQETPVTVAAPKIASLADAAKKAMPSVVNIYTSKEVRGHRAPLTDDPILRRFFPGLDDSEPRRATSLGSGVIVSREGYVLTNNHVVEEADDIELVLADGRRMHAAVRGSDPESDLAVLKIDGKNLPVITFGQLENVQVGDTVLAIGSPFGFGSTVTHGIVSALGRSHLGINRFEDFIQTDAAVNPGNSGGPLFNLKGEVIGINSQIFSRSGGSQGLAFAIPIDVAMQVEQQIVQHGKVTHGRLGVAIQDVNQALAGNFGLKTPKGALVSSVQKDGAGAKAGLKPGDVILTLNGEEIAGSSDLPPKVASLKPGSSVTLGIWRDGAEKQLTATLGAMDDAKNIVASAGSQDLGNAKLGIAVRPLTAEERRDKDIAGGLVVQDVAGAAERAGVRPGDVIVAVNTKPVKSVEELKSLVAKSGKTVALLVQRDNAQIFIPITMG